MSWTFLLLSSCLLRQAEEAPRPRDLVLTGVTVIDGTGAPRRSNLTVVIAAGRIRTLGKAGEVSVPEGAQVVDSTGKFLIPGLWDMHVHTGSKEIFFPLFLANGVTGVRDMGGDLERLEGGNLSVRFETLDRWRREVIEGKVPGPRIVAAGPFVDGPKPVWPSSIAVADEAAARQAVSALKKRGGDFVKVYEVLPRDAYFAIADEARKRGLPFAGHVPYSVSAAEASDAGQKSIEHLTGILLACSAREAEARDDILERLSAQGFGVKAKSTVPKTSTEPRRGINLLETYSDEKARALFARFARNGTWQVPTLSVAHVSAFIDDERVTKSPQLKYLPISLREAWSSKTNVFFKDRRPEYSLVRKREFQKELEIVGAMHRSGVGLLAGSDAANPYVVPGFSLHEELVLLVEAGLSPTAALETATRNPAEYLGLRDSLGTVEPGKIADLVLLDADPTVDITNTRKIAAVLVGGRWISKREIEEMLAVLEAMAAKS